MAEWVFYNPNPSGRRTGDCVVRAISAATKTDWDGVYSGLSAQGYIQKDMPSANAVWATYLKRRGYKMGIMPDTCPDCYTVSDFADDHPQGTFIIGTGDHAVAIIDGRIFDSWDSRSETVLYFFEEV